MTRAAHIYLGTRDSVAALRRNTEYKHAVEFQIFTKYITFRDSLQPQVISSSFWLRLALPTCQRIHACGFLSTHKYVKFSNSGAAVQMARPLKKVALKQFTLNNSKSKELHMSLEMKCLTLLFMCSLCRLIRHVFLFVDLTTWRCFSRVLVFCPDRQRKASEGSQAYLHEINPHEIKSTTQQYGAQRNRHMVGSTSCIRRGRRLVSSWRRVTWLPSSGNRIQRTTQARRYTRGTSPMEELGFTSTTTRTRLRF